MNPSPRGSRDGNSAGTRGQLRHESLKRFVAECAARQYGVIALGQAVALGMTRSAIHRRVTSGEWESVLPGVYRVRGAPITEHQRLMGAILWAGVDAVISHESAAKLWRLDARPPAEVHVTVPRRKDPRSEIVVVHRTLALPEMDRRVILGIPVTSAARTVIDLAAGLRGEALEALVESGFHHGLYREPFLRWRLSELGGTGRPGSARLRDVLDQRGAGAVALESRLEVKAWRLLTRSSLPHPVRQHRVEIGGRRYRIDFAWPYRRVGLECDGYDAHGGRLAFRRDRRKLAALAAAGWRIVPATWDDVVRRPESLLHDLSTALGAHLAS